MKTKSLDVYLFCFYAFSHSQVPKEMLLYISRFELDGQLKMLIDSYKTKKNNKNSCKDKIVNYCRKIIKEIFKNDDSIEFELNELQILANITQYRLEKIFSVSYDYNLSLTEQQVLFFALNNYKEEVFNILRVKLEMKNHKSNKNKNSEVENNGRL